MSHDDKRGALIAKLESMEDDGSEGMPWSQEEIDLIISSLRATPSADLPSEPTRAMLDAWSDVMRGIGRHRPSTAWPGLHYSDGESLMVDAYRAMLSAAPASAGVSPEDKDTRILELHSNLYHSLQNTDEAIEHFENFAEQVLGWCGEAVAHFAQATDNAEAEHRWSERARLVRKLLEQPAETPQASPDTDAAELEREHLGDPEKQSGIYAAQFSAMAWGDRIRDEQLDELLVRAEKSQTVLLRIDQFRDLVLQAKSPSSAERATVTDEMVDRFLAWRLPEDFHPDAGISFSPYFNVEYNAKHGKPPQRHQPIGTNLFTADQARRMLEHVLQGAAASSERASEPMPRSFEYMLNAMEHAAQQPNPASHAYAEKRRAVFQYVQDLWDDYIRLLREKQDALLAPKSANRLTKCSDKHPPPHAKYTVHRDGLVFTATPCYGMHSPWWVVRTMEGEAPPVSIMPSDEWELISEAEGRGANG